jgi:hypothetical protein
MHKRSSISAGLIMILIGGLFLIVNLFPGSVEQLNLDQQWPLIVVGVGIILLLRALFGKPSFAMQGIIVMGIGFILYYQNMTNNWASWAYMWTLIPGFAGIGMVLMNLLDQRKRSVFREGGRLILISAALFILFSAFFNSEFGNIGQLWPVLLIVVGLWMLFRNRFAKS